jgi:hypothetical protein
MSLENTTSNNNKNFSSPTIHFLHVFATIFIDSDNVILNFFIT